jgi:nitric oxide reductase activation protein
LATELHICLIAPDYQRSASQWSHLEPEFPEGVEQGDSAMFEDEGNADEPADTISLSLEAQKTLQKLLAAVRSSSAKRKTARRRKATVVLNFDSDPEGDEEAESEEHGKKRKPKRRLHSTRGRYYLYDEWDYLIEDYRTQWCQVREIPLVGDDGAFFSRTLTTYADLTPEIKREFQRLRPRLYRHIKGLEDGEEIDLDAAITARVDQRTGNTHSPKLYAARLPVERDVAALFLLDLSASTDALVSASRETRVIDIMKEALVLLSAALDTIGDTYAIYGFSSAGRRDVDLYPVKTFAESLSQDVRGRVGGLTPQRSTRMGAAVRHGTRQLRTLSSRAKFLVLLSDGHPEDMDYGPDKHSPTYGVRDTMMALREAERGGILSFCLTVDKAGRDYLREMCAPSRYMIIEDMTSLPTELPKIYQRYIRSQKL